jgi:hypothetical protein
VLGQALVDETERANLLGVIPALEQGLYSANNAELEVRGKANEGTVAGEVAE